MKNKLKKLSFYKKKPFYIVLVVLFSLLLIADILIAAFAHDQSNEFGNRQNADMSSSFGENMASGDMPSMDGNTESGDMPSMDGNTESGDMPSFDEDISSDDMPSFEDFDFSDIQSDNDMSSNNGTGFLQWVKSHWLVIFIILIVFDGASIFMLIRICRKEKKVAARLQEEMKKKQAAGEVQHIAKPVNKKKSSHLFWIIPVAGVILLVLVVKILSANSTAEASQTEATIYSETAQLSDISTVLSGAGTLTEETAEELSLASDVEISSWYVSNGDTVSEGDKIAEVDRVSVMTAITSIQALIAELDEEIAEHEDETIADKITASAAGRVMAIYALEDESVVNVMYENSALMLISLDGNLAVAIETDADISVGDSVDVTLSDSTVISGKVESITNNTAVIVVSDEEAALDDEVAVAAESGDSIGTGILYIHSELKVTGFTGTIESVDVSVGDEVSEGDTLISLSDTEYEGEYETLTQQRQTLTEQLQELILLYYDGYIYASCSGVVSGINSDDTTDSDEEAGTSQASLQNNDITIVTTSLSDGGSEALESEGESGVESAYVNYIGIVTDVTDSTIEMKLLSGTYVLDDYSDLSDINLDEASMTETASFDISSFKIVLNSEEGALSVSAADEICSGDTLILAYDADDIYSLAFVVNFISAAKEQEAETGTAGGENTAEAGTESEGENAQMSASNNAENEAAAGSNQAGDILDTGNYSDSQTDANSVKSADMAETSDSAGSVNSADNTENDEAQEALDAQEALSESSEDSTDNAAYAGASTAGTSYSIAESTVLSITPQETMTITITVDELDILLLETGQTALVTLDAFPGQSFEGEVTAINTTGTNSGGNTKFTAEVTINREENMLAGMNSSVVITIDTKENVLSIPEAALLEKGSSVYVYTSYDEKTETLGGLVEVTTGVSDGENVEILSGLEEGSTFYYSYLDTVNYSSATTSSGSTGFSIDSIFSGSGGGR